MLNRFPQLRRAGEGGIHAFRKSELGEDFIAGDVTDVVRHQAPVGRRDVASLPEYSSAAPERIAEKQAEQIKQMRAQYHHVLAAGARVLFAEGADLDHVSDLSLRDGLFKANH